MGSSKQKRSQASSKQSIEGVPEGEYVGTLRWGPDLQIPKLEKAAAGKTGSLESWQAFCSSRLRGTSLEINNQIQLSAPHLIDALSFPLSFCWCVRRLVEQQALPAAALLRSPKLRIVAAGCTHRLEQRILQESNCFQELEQYFPHSEVRLCMVGPEVRVPKRKGNAKGSSKKARKGTSCEWTKESDRFSWTLQQGTVKDFLKAHPGSAGKNETTVVIAYNSGMGSGDKKLQESWAADVAFLLDQDILCLFTCANDYMDVPGERRVMQKHNACFLLEPCACPFAAMTVLVPEGPHSHCTTQANSFVYAVKGRAGKTVPVSGPAALGVHTQQVPQVSSSTASAATAQSHVSIPATTNEVAEQRADAVRALDRGAPDSSGALTRGAAAPPQPSASASDAKRQAAPTDSKAVSPPTHAGALAPCSGTSSTAPAVAASAAASCGTRGAGASGGGINCGMSHGVALNEPVTTDIGLTKLLFFDLRGLDIGSNEAEQLQVKSRDRGKTLAVLWRRQLVYTWTGAGCNFAEAKASLAPSQQKLRIVAPNW